MIPEYLKVVDVRPGKKGDYSIFLGKEYKLSIDVAYEVPIVEPNNVYNAFYVDLVPPPGYEFTGEYMDVDVYPAPEKKEYFLTTRGTVGFTGINIVSKTFGTKRFILKKINMKKVFTGINIVSKPFGTNTKKVFTVTIDTSLNTYYGNPPTYLEADPYSFVDWLYNKCSLSAVTVKKEN